MIKKPARRPARPAADRPKPPAFAPAAPRARRDGWTPEKQTAFIEALAASGCVAEACAAVGMSRTAAYALRATPHAQAFRVAWDAALDLAIRRLSDECYSRALNGVPVPHYYQGEQVGEHRRYDDRLAMFLLRYRDPLRYAASLDQMVYKGHVERAALIYAHAHNRLGDEAWGEPSVTAPGDPDPGALPYDTVPLVEQRAAEAEQALVAGSGIIGGSPERRRRLTEQRQARVQAEWDAHRARDAATATEVGRVLGTGAGAGGG